MLLRISSPAVPAPPPGAPAPVAPFPSSTGTAPQRHGVILVVDDSSLILLTVTKALQSRGYEVIQAVNGRLGLATWEEHKDSIQVVVSDVFMPEMDGLSMAREIRKRSRSVPILLMSSKLDEDTRWVAEEAGFRLLPKPFKDEVLLMVVDRLIRTPRPA
jgi:DNA-binding response OmpR family regulator